VKAEVFEQLGEGAARIEAQVIAAGIEVSLERAHLKRPPEHLKAPVAGRAQQQTAAWAQHAAHFGQPTGGVGDVLDHLARPHRVKARVLQWPGSFGPHLPQVELRMAHARAPQRLGGDVDTHHLCCARAREREGEASLAAAHVQHPLARSDMV